MKKIIIGVICVLVLLVFVFPSVHKSLNFKSDKDILNVVPVSHSFSQAKDYVLITDEIEIFKKFLVETPIDLNVTEDSPNKVVLKSEDEEKRFVIFRLLKKEENGFTYDFLDQTLNVTYDAFNGKKSLFSPMAHNKRLMKKKMLMSGSDLLKFDENSKKGFVIIGGENKATIVNLFINDLSIEINFAGIGPKERDYILYTFKTAN